MAILLPIVFEFDNFDTLVNSNSEIQFTNSNCPSPLVDFYSQLTANFKLPSDLSYQIKIGRYNRNDKTIISPAPLNTIKRLICHLGEVESYQIIANKYRQNITVPDKHYLLFETNISNYTITVADLPNRRLTVDGKRILSKRSKTYSRITIIIDILSNEIKDWLKKESNDPENVDNLMNLITDWTKSPTNIENLKTLLKDKIKSLDNIEQLLKLLNHNDLNQLLTDNCCDNKNCQHHQEKKPPIKKKQKKLSHAQLINMIKKELKNDC